MACYGWFIDVFVHFRSPKRIHSYPVKPSLGFSCHVQTAKNGCTCLLSITTTQPARPIRTAAARSLQVTWRTIHQWLTSVSLSPRPTWTTCETKATRRTSLATMRYTYNINYLPFPQPLLSWSRITPIVYSFRQFFLGRKWLCLCSQSLVLIWFNEFYSQYNLTKCGHTLPLNHFLGLLQKRVHLSKSRVIKNSLYLFDWQHGEQREKRTYLCDRSVVGLNNYIFMKVLSQRKRIILVIVMLLQTTERWRQGSRVFFRLLIS